MYGIPTIQQDLQEEVAYVPMYVYSLLFLHMLLDFSRRSTYIRTRLRDEGMYIHRCERSNNKKQRLEFIPVRAKRRSSSSSNNNNRRHFPW